MYDKHNTCPFIIVFATEYLSPPEISVLELHFWDKDSIPTLWLTQRRLILK